MSKKTAATMVCLACVFALTLGLCACGGNDTEAEAAIESEITEQLDDLKDCRGEAMDIVKQKLNDSVGTTLDDMGVDRDELVSTYMDGFDYKVDDVSVTGKSAEARVTLTCRSVPTIVKDYLLALMGGANADASTLMQYVKDSALGDSTINVYVSQSDDGSWDVQSALTDAISEMVGL
jgi:hypothetical protein